MTILKDNTLQTIDQEGSEGAVEAYSWRTVGNQVAIKRLDRSAFYHHGTGIPIEVRPFFGLERLSRGETRDTVLVYNDKRYPAAFSRKKDKDSTGRTQLHWHSDFSSILRNELPTWYDLFGADPSEVNNPPELRFSRTDKDNEYLVTILDVESIASDIDSERVENQDLQPLREGGVKEYYGKRYERSAENRRRAIEIHGYECAVCGFDFSKVYGHRGKGFIEVHHIKPLSTVQEEAEVNPDTDLIPVCANCHRMIHRDSNDVLTVDELKGQLKTN